MSDILKNPYLGTGNLPRTKYPVREMRITATLLCDGRTPAEALEQITAENLFQYPTERELRSIAKDCLERLALLRSDVLLREVAYGRQMDARQVCLYASMLKYRIIYDFMVKVVGEKYRRGDNHITRLERATFLLHLREQDAVIGKLSVNTVNRVQRVLGNILVMNGYLDNPHSDRLNNTLIAEMLEKEILTHGDRGVLPAFNYFL